MDRTPIIVVLAALVSIAAVAQADVPGADPANPALATLASPHQAYDNQGAAKSRAVTGYDDQATWAAALGTLTLVDFEAFADGTLITTEFAPYGIPMVTGDKGGSPVDLYVTSSASLPFAMFVAGTLPSEPNFFSIDLGSGIWGTGSITFTFSVPQVGVGAYIADQGPLGDFAIEVFDGATSLGTITVGPRTLPDSFVGIISDTPFDSATFYAVDPNDSWGMDNLELTDVYPVELQSFTIE
jgi:hypothetical protein